MTFDGKIGQLLIKHSAKKLYDVFGNIVWNNK